jgi:hypothetical protein
LKQDSLEAFSSFLNIVLSIPTTILDEGDAAVSTFYTNLSTCVGSKGDSLKQSFLSLTPVFEDIGGKIEEGAKEAGGFIRDLISGTLPITLPADADVVEDVKKLPDVVTSAIAPLITNILPFSVSTVSKRQGGPALGSVAEIFNSLDSLRACLSGAIATNPVFEAAKCTLSIASVALPASRLLKARRAVDAVDGGVKRILQLLGTAKSVEEVLRGGGQGVIDVLAELTGLSDGKSYSCLCKI